MKFHQTFAAVKYINTKVKLDAQIVRAICLVSSSLALVQLCFLKIVKIHNIKRHISHYESRPPKCLTICTSSLEIRRLEELHTQAFLHETPQVPDYEHEAYAHP
jgi:hypothetical protein